MPGSGASSGPYQELVDPARSNNLVNQRVHCGAAPVDDALSADLDHSGIRQDAEVRRRVHRSLKLRVGK
jgi:hypothetical protein